ETLAVAAGAGGISLLESDAVTVAEVEVGVTTVSVAGVRAPSAPASLNGLVTSANGGIVLKTLDGSLTVSAGGVSANGTGNILLQTQSAGADADLVLNGFLASEAGSISLLGARNVTQNAAVSTGDAGTIDVRAGSGSIAMTDAAGITTTAGGNIRYKATENVTVGRVNAGTGKVSLISDNGSILDGGDTGGADVTAAQIRFNAGTGVGILGASADGLETAAATVSAAAGAGGIHLSNTGDLAVGAVAVDLSRVKTDGTLPVDSDLQDASQSDLITASGGSIVLAATGRITLDDADADYLAVSADTSGSVRVQAGNGMVINSGVSSGSGALSLLSTTGTIVQGAEALISTTGASIDIEATAGAVSMVDKARVLSSGIGDVRVKAAGNISVAAIDAGTGNVSLISTTGSILDNGDTHVDVKAVGLRLQAGGGIGELGDGNGAIETTVTSIGAVAGGAISLYETDDLIVGAVAVVGTRVRTDGTIPGQPDITDAALSDLTATGAIVLRTYDGSIHLGDGLDADGIAVASSGAGNILISAGDKDSPATSDVTIGANVVSAGGAISVLAAHGVIQAALVSTTGASIDIQAASGAVTMETTASALSSGAGNIRYAAGTDLRVGVMDAGTGNIDLVASAGSVTRNSTGILVAAGLRLQGGLAVGSAENTGNGPLLISVATVSAAAGAGGMYLLQGPAVAGGAVPDLTVGAVSVPVGRVGESGALEANPISSGVQSDLTASGGGPVAVQTPGALSLVDGADGDSTAVQTADAGSILIVATGSLAVNAAVTSDFGDILLLSTGFDISQTEIGDIGTGIQAGVVDALSGTITVAAAGGITMASGASATATGAGDIRYLADGDITAGAMDAGTGNVSIVSVSGSILDNADGAGTVKAVGLRLEAATGIGQATGTGNGLLEIDAGGLAALSGVGGIHLAEANDIVTGSAPSVFSADDGVPSAVLNDLFAALGLSPAAEVHYLAPLGDVDTLGSLTLTVAETASLNDGDADGSAVEAAGAIQIVHGGVATVNAGISGGSVAFSGEGQLIIEADITGAAGVVFNGTGEIQLGADVTASAPAAAIFVDSAVILLTADVGLATNGGSVTLDEVITDTAGDHVLTITGGDVVLDDNLGSEDAAIAGLVIASSGNVSFIQPSLIADPNDPSVQIENISASRIDAGALTISATGDVLFNAEVTVGGPVSILCAALDLNGALTISGLDGTATFTNSGIAAISGDITSSGAVLFNGTGTIELGADVTVTGLGVGFEIIDSVLLLTGDRRIETHNGAIRLDELATDTALDHVLTLAAGLGAVTIDDNTGVQATALGGLTVESAGAVHFSGTDATTDVGALTISCTGETIFDGVLHVGSADVTTDTLKLNAALTSSGTITVVNAGRVDIEGTITAGATVWIKGPGALHLGADVTVSHAGDFDGSAPVVLTTDVAISNTGSGSVYFRQIVDSDAGEPGCRLLTITANSQTGVVSFDETVGGIAPLGGVMVVSAGHVAFAKAVTTCGAGLTLNTATAQFSGPVTTNSGGSVAITHTDTLTIDAGAPFVLDGPFNQNGTGAITITGSITTSAEPISFAGAVTLSGPLALNTGDGGGDVGFAATVGGLHALTVQAGTGAVLFGGAVGTPAKLTGLSVAGGAVAFTGPVQTTAGGAVSIQNSGLLNIGAAALMTLDGAFAQSGTGAVRLGADIRTSNDAISFAATTTLLGDITVNSTGGAVTFVGIATETHGTASLIIDAGAGGVTFNAAVGSADAAVGVLRVDRSGGIVTSADASMKVSGILDFNASGNILIGAPILAAGGIAMRAGTTGTGSVTVAGQGSDYSLKVDDQGADLVIHAGDTAGDVILSGNVMGVDSVFLNAPGGWIRQFVGVVSGDEIVFEAARAVIGDDGQGQQEFLWTSTAKLIARSLGDGNIQIRNIPRGVTGALEVAGLKTLGGHIWLEQYYSETDGIVTVTGDVTTGDPATGVDGGSIRIDSAKGLEIGAVEISTLGTPGGAVTISNGVVQSEFASISSSSTGDIHLLVGQLTDLLIINTDRISSEKISLTNSGDIIVRSLLQTTSSGSDITITADSDGDGHGGVIIAPEGLVKSGRHIIISGSDCITTVGSIDSVVIRDDGVKNQLEATGDILIQSGPSAPANAVVQIEGQLLAYGSEGILFDSAGETRTSTTIVAQGGDVEFQRPVFLAADTVIDTRHPGGTEGSVFFRDTVTGTGALSVFTGTGDVSFEAAVGSTGAYPGALYIDTTALTFMASVNVNGAITLIARGAPVLGPYLAAVGRGDIMIRAPADVTLPILRSVDGKIDVQAGATITAHDIVSQAGSETNLVRLESVAGNILLGAVNGGAGGLVTLLAPAGVVADDSPEEGWNVRAGRLVIDALAAGVLPGLDDLDLAVGRLNIATSGTAGNVAVTQVAEAGDLMVERIFVQGALNSGGVYVVAQGGAVTVEASGGGIVVDGPGNLLVETLDALSDIRLNDLVALAGGSASLRAGRDLRLGDGVAVTLSGPASAQLSAGLGTLAMNATARMVVGSGDVRMQASGDLTVSLIQSLGTVHLLSLNGSVRDAGDHAVHVSAGSLAVQAAIGIGTLGATAAPFEISVDQLAAQAGAGGINLLESDGLSISRVSNGNLLSIQADGTTESLDQGFLSGVRCTGGSIVLRSLAGDLGVQRDVFAAGAGNVLLDAAGDVLLFAAVESESGHISVLAGGDVFMGASVVEGGTVVLTAGSLLYTDGNSSTTELTYTLTALPSHGVLSLDGVVLGQGDTFTQADVNNELLVYTHDGSETAADGFAFGVADALGGTTNGAVTIYVDPVNDAPEHSVPASSAENRLNTNAGVDIFFTGDRAIGVSDADSGVGPIVVVIEITPAEGAAVLTVTVAEGVTAVGNGSIRLTLTGALAAIDATLATLVYDIQDPAAYYTDTMRITTDDQGYYGRGGALSTASQVHIKVNAVPVLSANVGLALNEGAVAAIDGSLLEVVDDDDTTEFRLMSGPLHGTLARDGVALLAGDVFTQADVDAGLLRYTHDGSETVADGFVFTVADESGGAIGETNFDIVVTPVNDAPVVTGPDRFTGNLGDDPADPVTIAINNLTVSDPDAVGTDSAVLSFTVTGNGGLWASGATGLQASGNGTGQLALTGDYADVLSWLAGLGATSFLDFQWAEGAHGSAQVEVS
ncbi:MAG: cadherin-like domain-containing protein, partial [Desulfobacteraceae bacterium]|nr:cadherin-like domain-containing protein [Desulfobacteraceae bacterium]